MIHLYMKAPGSSQSGVFCQNGKFGSLSSKAKFRAFVPQRGSKSIAVCSLNSWILSAVRPSQEVQPYEHYTDKSNSG